MADFKDEISPAMVAALAAELRTAWSGFGEAAFIADASADLGPLALLERIRHVAAALGRAMPADFPAAAAVLHAALGSATFTGWMTLPCGYFVAAHGLDQPEVALPALAALSPRFSSEGPIRFFIERHPETTFEHLRRWAVDPDEHVRRLVSEGTRPRLPWAPLLRGFIADPAPTIALLDLLHDDESAYVRRSVANHLNDIAKDHPTIAVATAGRWAANGGPGSRWVVRHGLRTLVKRGDPDALALLGYGTADGVTATAFTADPAALPVGTSVTLHCTLVADRDLPVVIDYAVHHVGAAGVRPAKVFKWATRTPSARQPVTVTRRHQFRRGGGRDRHGIHSSINRRVTPP